MQDRPSWHRSVVRRTDIHLKHCGHYKITAVKILEPDQLACTWNKTKRCKPCSYPNQIIHMRKSTIRIQLQNVVCSPLFLTWHEPVVSQSGQCFDWPVSSKVGLGPPPRHFLVEVKFLLTFIASCSKRLSPDTCVYELWTFMALKHFGGASWKGSKNEYLCVINDQFIQMFYNQRLLSPSAVCFYSLSKQQNGTLHLQLDILIQTLLHCGIRSLLKLKTLDWKCLLPVMKGIYFQC